MARKAGRGASAPLIATKLAIPRRREDTLRRARLVSAIHETIDRQLYLVVAPAGYGKTTLLVDFASDAGIPVGWYALDPSDGEPAVFLEYLMASIQSRFPRFGRDTRQVMAEASFPTDALAVAAALLTEIRDCIPNTFAVVLDDYHEVNNSPALNAMVDWLLKHAPLNLKLIVASRTMPKMQLSRLAAIRQAAGVGAKELRFTADEVRDVMHHGLHTVLPERVLEQLTARSEGWITGLLLTAHTEWQGLFESMVRKAGQEELFEYLAGQVFERQTTSVQRFLLATSVLEDVEPAVAGVLAGTSRAGDILRDLQERNLFVSSLEGRKPVYRYHQLFRDFLRSRLDEGASGAARPDLERRAGLLYQQRGRHQEAIPHLLAGGALEEATESIATIGQDVLSRGRIETLAGWIDGLPERLRLAHPQMALWQMQLADVRNQAQAASRMMAGIAPKDGAASRPGRALRLMPAVSRA